MYPCISVAETKLVLADAKHPAWFSSSHPGKYLLRLTAQATQLLGSTSKSCHGATFGQTGLPVVLMTKA